MKTNPILEEVWRIKDELAREAGNDVHRLCENTRKWAETHVRPGPLVHDAQELQLLNVIDKSLVLREEPPATKP